MEGRNPFKTLPYSLSSLHPAAQRFSPSQEVPKSALRGDGRAREHLASRARGGAALIAPQAAEGDGSSPGRPGHKLDFHSYMLIFIGAFVNLVPPLEVEKRMVLLFFF